MTNSIVDAFSLIPHNARLTPGEKRWDILCCVSGSITVDSGTDRLILSETDIAVLPPETTATVKGTADSSAYLLTLEDLTASAVSAFVISSPDNARMLPVIRNAVSYYSENSTASVMLLPAYGSLIAAFVQLGIHPGSNQIVNVIQRELMDNAGNSDFDIGAYLSSLPFSRDYLSRLFKEEYGMTPHQYLTDIRLENAKRLLICSNGNNISETAHLSGFRDPLYFSRLFSRKFGYAPSRLNENS